MKELDLEKRLRSLPIPERSDEYWEMFPRRVVSRLRAPSVERPARSRWPFRLAWGFGVALAGCLIAYAFVSWPGSNDQTDWSLLQNHKMLREVLSMFPNQVRAIEQDQNGVQLVLSDKPDVPTSTPLWIRICQGSQCRVVVTFSGQQLQIAEEKVEVLADAQGQIMLLGDRLFWSSAGPDRMSDHLRIQARPLS